MDMDDSLNKMPSGAAPKKPYEKPSFRSEQVFVTTALSCGKTSVQAQCMLTPKTS